MLFNGNTDTQQQFTGTRFSGVTVIFGKFRFQVGSLHVVVVGGVRIGVNRIALGHRGPHLGMPHHDYIEHPHIFKRKLILTQFTEALMRVKHYGAGRRFEITAQDFHES